MSELPVRDVELGVLAGDLVISSEDQGFGVVVDDVEGYLNRLVLPFNTNNEDRVADYARHILFESGYYGLGLGLTKNDEPKYDPLTVFAVASLQPTVKGTWHGDVLQFKHDNQRVMDTLNLAELRPKELIEPMSAYLLETFPEDTPYHNEAVETVRLLNSMVAIHK